MKFCPTSKFIVPAKILVNEGVVSSIDNSLTTYFSMDINSQGLTLSLSASKGALLMYASCTLSTPNEAFYTWKLSTDTTTNKYVSRSATTGRTSSVIYTSVRGYMANNIFTYNASVGDVSIPQRKCECMHLSYA